MGIKGSKKERAYQLFAAGYLPKSADVKALELKAKTVRNYYDLWKKAGRIVAPDGTETSDAFIPKGSKKTFSEADLFIEPAAPESSQEGESVEREPSSVAEIPISESSDDEGDEAGEDKAANGKISNKGDGSSPAAKGRKLGTMVAGQGLQVAVTLSLKTLTLYQYAASLCTKEALTLGDFIDTCVEDYYKGRGLDLGIIKIGGDGKNG